jgi:apolipoprotein N-acyltransferase
VRELSDALSPPRGLTWLLGGLSALLMRLPIGVGAALLGGLLTGVSIIHGLLWPLAIIGVAVLDLATRHDRAGWRGVIGLVWSGGWWIGLAIVGEAATYMSIPWAVASFTATAVVSASCPPNTLGRVGLAILAATAWTVELQVGGRALAATQLEGQLAAVARLGGGAAIVLGIVVAAWCGARLVEQQWRHCGVGLLVLATVLVAGRLAPNGASPKLGVHEVAIVQTSTQQPTLADLTASLDDVAPDRDLVLFADALNRQDAKLLAAVVSERATLAGTVIVVSDIDRPECVFAVTTQAASGEPTDPTRHCAFGDDNDLIDIPNRLADGGQDGPDATVEIVDINQVDRDERSSQQYNDRPYPSYTLVVGTSPRHGNRTHSALLRLRAFETGRWLAVAGPGEALAIYNPGGVIGRQIPVGQAGVIVGPVGVYDGRTLSVRFPEAVLRLVTTMAGLTVAWFGRRSGRSRRAKKR